MSNSVSSIPAAPVKTEQPQASPRSYLPSTTFEKAAALGLALIGAGAALAAVYYGGQKIAAYFSAAAPIPVPVPVPVPVPAPIAQVGSYTIKEVGLASLYVFLVGKYCSERYRENKIIGLHQQMLAVTEEVDKTPIRTPQGTPRRHDEEYSELPLKGKWLQ